MLNFAAVIGPIAGLVAGAIAALALGRFPRTATAVGAGSAIAACLAGLCANVAALLGALPAETWSAPWRVPSAALVVGSDPLSAFFAVALYGLGGLAAVFGAVYLAESAARRNLGVAWFAYDLLLAGMAGVLAARNGVLFLLSWEVMSIAGWALVAFEHDKEEVRRAGWIYLVATHTGAVALLVVFLELLGISGASADFTQLHGAAVPSGVFALALFGFGTKAGFAPMHVWLPEAHAAAPSHVSAVMSGVMVKMGIYGILRIVLAFGAPPWLGPVLGSVGFAGAFTGIGLALGERDLKRALAYSTVENVGLVAVGIGLGCWGRARGLPDVAALGFSAGLLHAWNHTAMKGLMFLGAGSVAHGAGTRDLEKLGGLLRRMPATAVCAVYGAVALAALPPLNGFASEWLLYLGLVRGGRETPGLSGLTLLLAVGLLAFVGAMTAAAFARLVGIAFLGQPRSVAADHAHESPRGMLGPMAVLVALCTALGLAPRMALLAAGPVVAELAGGSSGAPALPGPVAEAVAPVGPVAVAVWASVLLLARGLRGLVSRRPARESVTWDCGYSAPSPRMQYTARAFSALATSAVLPAVFHATEAVGDRVGIHPEPATLTVARGDPLLDRVFLPFLRAAADRLKALHQLQEGRTWVYLAYIGVTLAVALAWSAFGSGS